jgi:hypothetical protein
MNLCSVSVRTIYAYTYIVIYLKSSYISTKLKLGINNHHHDIVGRVAQSV